MTPRTARRVRGRLGRGWPLLLLALAWLPANRVVAGTLHTPPIDAAGKHVIIEKPLSLTLECAAGHGPLSARDVDAQPGPGAKLVA